MPNKALGTKAKFEKVRIEAEEMLDAAEVHFMCFGEFLFLLICELGELFCKELLSSAYGLTKLRHGRDKAWGCREDS
jgi:hypothetical protein